MADATLPPDIEAQLAVCEQRNTASRALLTELSQSVDELIDTLDGEGLAGDAVPEEAFDDPSVVRHMEATTRTAARVKRASTPQPARVHEAVLKMGVRR